MVALVFIANLLMAILAVVLCGWHAWGSRDRLTFLGVGVIYGVLLEWLVIQQFAAYQYNADDFLLTIAEVPVVIGLGWAAIMYSGFEIASRFDLSKWRQPLFVALFALHIDLAIDAIAIRVPFWRWTPPGVWFGVPMGNFVGWFLVAGLFPAAWLGLSERVTNQLSRGLLTIVLAVAGLILLLEGWTSIATTVIRKIVILGTVLATSLVVVARDVTIPGGAIDWRLSSVPVLYHGFYLLVLLGFGLYEETPAILAISLLMIGVTGGVHRLTDSSVA